MLVFTSSCIAEFVTCHPELVICHLSLITRHSSLRYRSFNVDSPNNTNNIVIIQKRTTT